MMSVHSTLALRLAHAFLVMCIIPKGTLAVYHGKLIGSITTYYHNFRGTVYAATAKSVVITDLNYDGGGPAAHFWAGSNVGLDNYGDQLLDEEMSTKVLKPYKNATVFLRLPRKITEYKSLGIYCELFGIPVDYELPKEQSLGTLTAKQHNTMAAEVILKDSATILLKGFEYSAACPGSAFFVAGLTASTQPDQLTRLINDNGKTSKLGRYDKKDVTARLPLGRHWNEFKWFSVYCVDAKQSYAEIAINQAVAEKLPLHDPKTVVPMPSTESTDNEGATFAPFSALWVFTLISVSLAAAFAIRRCLESDNRIKIC
ncbi:protein Skeletor, isoforms B/C-like isoform X2 [Dermacentor albipictus]|uniref:protein Skeletor, isoforms B/C-like isoform X2 n=1 Tax=Dermacentor albipictus TaxID=60249 RepID=UPI0031FBC63C